MPQITIEMDDNVQMKTCLQCGGKYPRVHGFLYRDGDAWVVYWADLYKDHPNHPEPKAVLIIALGEDWSEGSDPEGHAWATLEAWPDLDQVKMSFIEPFGELDPLHFGLPLSREAVIGHRWNQSFLKVADEIAYRDTRVSRLLGTTA
jgi:hypothetical protein